MLGTTCRTRRSQWPMKLPLAGLSAATGINIAKLSSFELGGRLSPDELNRVERALDQIERLCLALLPARVDLSDRRRVVPRARKTARASCRNYFLTSFGAPASASESVTGGALSSERRPVFHFKFPRTKNRTNEHSRNCTGLAATDAAHPQTCITGAR